MSTSSLLETVLSLLHEFSSNPVAEHFLLIEDGPLSSPWIPQHSSAVEQYLAVEDGFFSLLSILSQSIVPGQFYAVENERLFPQGD